MPISSSDLAHLLRRTEFVARPARVNELKALTKEEVVDDILDVTEAPSLPARLSNANDDGYEQYKLMTSWWLDRMVKARRPVQEKLTLFWFGHFTSAYWDVDHPPSMAAQNRLYRQNALGNYRAFIKRMSITPAMLVYLNNADNSFESPNQNFARELMELYVLGVGNYSEDDVVAAALAWGGHSVDWETRKYQYNSWAHPPASQRWTMFGKEQHWTGDLMIDEMLDNPTLRPVTARFITKKLWEFFAYPNPPGDLVAVLADEFIASGFNIKTLMRAILINDEFYTTTAQQGLVRTPTDYVVAMLFHMNIAANDVQPYWYLDAMGQDPLNPPNVSGWRPNGYWLNSSAFTGRAEFASHARWILNERGAFDWVATTAVADAVTRMCRTLGFSPAAPTRQAMERYLTNVRGTGDAWSQDVNLFVMAMLAPEFHQA